MCFVDVKSHFPQRWPSVLVAILLVQRPYLLNTTFIPLMAANSSTYISVQVHFLRVTVRPLCRSLGEGTEGARRVVGPPSGSRRQADANEAPATSGHRRGPPIASPAERRSVSPCRPDCTFATTCSVTSAPVWRRRGDARPNAHPRYFQYK